MFNIGHYHIGSQVVLAPMAGITDAPFRNLCVKFGAGAATSEMLTAKTDLWHSRKTTLRLNGLISLSSESKTTHPCIVQIAGSEPKQLATAAKACVDAGAQIVDINMGCPAKKVCNKAAGSALLKDEALVQEIVASVVTAVSVPVTLKIRTGWCPQTRNGAQVARIAEDNGIAALTVHGRTRACRFKGEVEYDTIAKIVSSVTIPVIANGDIDSPLKALKVLKKTGAQAVMVGRAAQGRPWIFQAINSYLKSTAEANIVTSTTAMPSLKKIAILIGEHLQAMYKHYGDYLGVRVARKHLKWYLIEIGQCFNIGNINQTLQTINKIDSSNQQHECVQYFFEELISQETLQRKSA